MASNPQIPVSVAEWSRDALELRSGARLLLLQDDDTGRGRDLYRALHRRIENRGLRILDLGSLGARRAQRGLVQEPEAVTEMETAHDPLFLERQREQLLDALRRGLTHTRRTDDVPTVMFVEDIEHVDDGTKLLLQMLLDAAEQDYPFGEDPLMSIMVVAMDRHGPTAEALARHPGTFRYDPTPTRAVQPTEKRRLPQEVIRAVRYLQLAALPLRSAELEHLAGTAVLTKLGRQGIGVQRSGRGPGASLTIHEAHPAGLPEPESLPEAELRRYHERLLTVFEARVEDAGCSVARFRHAVGAQSVEHVTRLAPGAMDALTRTRRFTEARELLEQGLEVLAGQRKYASDAIRLRRKLAILEAAAGKPLDAAARVQAIPRSRRSIEDELLLARGLLNAGRAQQAHQAIVESLSAGGSASTRVRLRAVLAEVEYVRGNLDEAIALCRELTQDRSLGPDDRARVDNTHGKIYLARGSYAEAEHIFKRNLKWTRGENLKRHAVIACINAGIARMRQLHYESAKKLFIRAREDAAREGLYREEAIARENIATVYHMLRDYAQAMEHYRTAFALLRYLDNPEYLSRIANNLGEIYLRFGDLHKAEATRLYAVKQGADYPVSQVEAEGMLLDGRVHMQKGDCGRAAETFAHSSRLFEGLGDRHHLAEALIFQAHSYLELDRTAECEELLKRASALTSDDERMKARLMLVTGCHRRLTGGDAESYLVQALKALGQSGDLEGELEALYALGEMELDRGDTVFARQHLERAREITRVIRSRVPERFHETFDASPVRRKLTTLTLRAQAMERDRRTERNADLENARSAGVSPYARLVGRSEAMQVVYRAIGRVAPLDDLVLIEGESGTGKELVAEAIHAQSARSSQPLVKINCASFVENLLQSELFGHERGAFTGAVRRRRGWFETASGGTLFLDEIGDISEATQVNLLRVLQDRIIHRVGGREAVEVDVRIITATNRDLRRAVARGRFRKDLFYRLQGLRIVVPPLRERISDLSLLADHVLSDICAEFNLERKKVRLSSGAMRLLEQLPWSGNVRELENVLRSAVLFADGGIVSQRELEPYVEPAQGNTPQAANVVSSEPELEAPSAGAETVDMNQVLLGAVSLPQFKKEIERRCITSALKETGGNITRAAALLGMKRPRLSQLVKSYGIDKDAMSSEE